MTIGDIWFHHESPRRVFKSGSVATNSVACVVKGRLPRLREPYMRIIPAIGFPIFRNNARFDSHSEQLGKYLMRWGWFAWLLADTARQGGTGVDSRGWPETAS